MKKFHLALINKRVIDKFGPFLIFLFLQGSSEIDSVYLV